ncbi:MAG: hypothetical protein B6D55_05320 [Candidatus Omnitrophica bacterium 4484_70.2]|nr:MAG: hypothetical protein B6D55_05320 [Candidatus Omnitrophica bacterium 4484_70.2]
MNEKELVQELKSLFENAGYNELFKVFALTNLATKRFHELWQEWWKTKFLPKLEVDMILVFREFQKQEVFMSAIEIKYFKDFSARDFREGIQQALSFGIFGFDSLILWHIFPEGASKEEIETIVKPCKDIVDGFRLPITYFATQLTKDNNKFELYAPWEWLSSVDINPYQMIGYIKNESTKKKNPRLIEEEVQRRRKLLKVLLKIPI